MIRTSLILRQQTRVLASLDGVTLSSYRRRSFTVSSDHNSSKNATPIRFKSTTTKDPVQEKDEKKSLIPEGMDLGISSLLPEWRNMFARDTLLTDISAGITVGCVAVPLNLAIALASGVPAEVGLVTAAVSGVAGGLLGGTTLAVTGPAAAISLLIVGAVQQHGFEALPFITLACGGLQLASGISKVGVVAKLVPVSVIAGFTCGVGSLILAGQVPKALGMMAPAGLNPIEVIQFVGENVAAIDPASAALALGTAGAMFFLPKLHPKIPAALIAVGGATLATHGLGLDVALIGSLPTGLAAFQFGLPAVPPVDAWASLAATTFLIFSMTSVESLLSCAALDKMKKTPYKYSPDQELIGQGVANISAGMFMGMPVTSVIARSGLNVRLNAETRLPALIQSGFVFSSVVFLGSSIAMIPMPALSGMLITTGISMLNPTEFKHCYAVQKMDVFPFVTSIAGMVTLGLAEGIGIGCVTAVALQMRNVTAHTTARMQVHEAVHAKHPQHGHFIDLDADAITQRQQEKEAHNDVDESHESLSLYRWNTVWVLSGPINFISMFEIDFLIKRMAERDDPEDQAIVLDMAGVTELEFTGECN